MKKSLLCICFAAMFSAGAAPVTAVETLFENGKTGYKICISPESGEQGQYAADELASFLKKISGADFQIEKTDKASSEKAIVLGAITDPIMKDHAAALKLAAAEDDEIVIRTIGKNLYIAGSNRRSALYAVYTFLEKALDVHFFWQGESGEFYSEMKKLDLPELNIRHESSFRYREMSLCGWHLHAPTEIFLSRNYLNAGLRTPAVYSKVGSYNSFGGHSVSLNKKDFEAHPDWFCMIDGKRTPEGVAGCWSNPEFLDAMVKKHIELAKKNNIQIFNIFPADVTERCECKECTANPDRSSRWFIFFEKMIEKMKPELPGVKFATLGYQEYRAIPTHKVSDVEYVEYCQYNRCYIHKLDNPDCKINQKSMDELRRWSEKAPMGIYGYEFDATSPALYYPFWNMLSDEIKVFRDMGIRRMKTEYPVDFNKKLAPEDCPSNRIRLSAYIYARLMWDADANVDALISDYCRVVFGPGAKPMKQYFDATAKSWDSMKSHLSYFLANPAGLSSKFLSGELIKEANGCFAAAEKEIAALPDSKQKQRMLSELGMEQKFFRQWEKYYSQVSAAAPPVAVPFMKDAAAAKASAVALPMIPQKPEGHKSEAKVWSDSDALYFEVTGYDSDMSALKRGQTEKDIALWSDDNVEFFIDFGEGYRHMAANLAGGKYDAIMSDSKWSPKWETSVVEEKDRWIMTVRMPFSELGATPSENDQWLLIVNRNHRSGINSGFPRAAYHDMTSAGVISFSSKVSPKKKVIWSNPPSYNKKLQHIDGFLKRGWTLTGIENNADGKADFADCPVIIISLCQENKFTPEYWKNILVPAVKNGALMVISAYGTPALDKFFEDPSMKVSWTDYHLEKLRRTTFISEEYGFDKTPNDMKKVLGHTPPGIFAPADPDKWIILAKQRMKEGDETAKVFERWKWTGGLDVPYLLARPCGNGLLVVTGVIDYAKGANEVAMLLENLQALQEKLKKNN